MGYITIDMEYVILLAAVVAAVAAYEADRGACSVNNEVRELRHDLYEADVTDESPYPETIEIDAEEPQTEGNSEK
jgi:hypothetical protein